jgi:hypothetical protein
MRHQPLLVLPLVLGVVSTAWGIGGTLSTPIFGYHPGIDAATKEKAISALDFMRKELKFLDGNYVNEFFHHRFGGTAPNTSRFVELLKESGAWQVRVAFRDFGEQETAFTLNQVMPSDEVLVTINSGRDDFRLKDFQAHLPQQPKESAKQALERAQQRGRATP